MGARKGRCCRRSGRSNKIFDMFFGVADYGSVPTKGQEAISTLRLGGIQLHNRSVFPRRKGKLLHVAWPCTTMDVRNCAAWALILKALIWNESWIRK
jgi:hypothetical protein